MGMTVERLCNLLAKYRLQEPSAIRGLWQRWRAEAGGAANDSERFSKWLVAGGAVTDFQLGMLTRGFADLLFLGDYRLLDRIGQGRMAGVYRAAHPSGVVVAIKVLPPSKAQNPQILGRFQREARLAIKLRHPNVVRTFHTGRTRGDLHYLVMEYLDGETLDEVLAQRKRLSPAESVHVLGQALRGLQHLDEVGMVHRDLKAGNLMLVPAPSGAGEAVLRSAVKILDIGMGRALFDEGAEGMGDVGDLTNEGDLIGTAGYMAPEQARDAHGADIRADIYSLGCVFYHMLTGQPPFVGSTPLAVLMGHVKEQPRPLRELNPSLPVEFQAVMDRMLAKDPAQRYATPNQALKAVSALAPHTVPAPPAPEPTQQMRTFLTWVEMNLDGDGEQAPAPPPPAAPAPARPAAPAVATPVAPAPVAAAARPVPVAVVSVPPPPSASSRSLLRPTPRELLYAGVGAAVGLALAGVVWLIVSLIR